MSINVTEYQDIFTKLENLNFKELGISFLGAFIIGFLLKKGLKLFFILFIIAFFLFLIFSNKELLELNNDILLNYSDKMFYIGEKLYKSIKALFDFFTISNSGAFISGFFLGFKLG